MQNSSLVNRFQLSSDKRYSPTPRLLKLICIILIGLGIIFRFTNLGQKAYWFDETFTSLRASGYTDVEFVQKYGPNPTIVSVSDLQKYQSPQPEKNVVDTIVGLAKEEPQHPPLYYVLARFWAQLFGSSVPSMRVLPAIFSVLVLPCVYWLCLELFESPLTGWLAMALIAISPFHLLLAQTARQNTLWAVVTLLSSVALLRALRSGTRTSWLIYAATMVLSFYTFLFSALVAIGHGIYVLLLERFRLTKNLVGYGIASLLALLLFLPWIATIFVFRSNVGSTTSWLAQQVSLLKLARGWVSNYVRLFIDLDIDLSLGSGTPLLKLLPILLSMPILLAVLGYSFYLIYRNTPPRVWLFIFTLVGASWLPLALFDGFSAGGTTLSTTGRYLVPAYLGVHLALAASLAMITTRFSGSWRLHKPAQAVLGLVFLMGTVSCVTYLSSDFWSNKTPSTMSPIVAGIVNQAERPLIVSDAWSGDLFSLSYNLDDKVKLLIAPTCYVCSPSVSAITPETPQIPPGFSEVFYFNLNSPDRVALPGKFAAWLKRLQQNSGVIELLGPYALWKVKMN